MNEAVESSVSVWSTETLAASTVGILISAGWLPHNMLPSGAASDY